MTYSDKLLRKLLYDMMRIRRVQLAIDARYLENEMKTPVHLCIGQEAVAVGVCAHLGKSDYINSNHRGHGHYLAKGGDLRAMIAELYGREDGCSKGRGGSMHLLDTRVGHFGSSSIVGGGIPIGTGMGLAIKMQKQKRVSVIFFGDGAADEGVLYESVNFAVLKKLPVIFILENNQYSVCSHVSARQAAENVFHGMKPRYLMSKMVDGNDVLAVYDASGKAVERARTAKGPSLIECRTYRIRGHAGCERQDPPGYRSEKEIEHWKKLCPVLSFQRKLIRGKIISPGDVGKIQDKIDREIREAFDFARQALPARADTVSRYLFHK